MDTTTTLPRASAPAAGHPSQGGQSIPGTAAPARPSPLARLWRGPVGDPQWARPALLALLLGTALLYFYNLTSSGWANSFYSAAVQAGSESWKAFLFGSSDAGNSITVDKPPASLWVMALSCGCSGSARSPSSCRRCSWGSPPSGWSTPRVKRHFGAAAGLLGRAGHGPDTGGRPDVPVQQPRRAARPAHGPRRLGHDAVHRAGLGQVVRDRRRTSSGSGFLTKALQVLLVVPAFGLAYLLFADTTLRRRITGALVGTAAMVSRPAGGWPSSSSCPRACVPTSAAARTTRSSR